MKFLLDQGLARSTVSFLAAIGLEAEHVGDLNLAKASDETILGEGRARDSVVVTLDSTSTACLLIPMQNLRR
jgi:predicted nuclease of predicted toxin-antitoxin system